MSGNVPDQMNVALLNEPFDIEIKEKDIPTITADEVLIKVMAVGVCGSDVHYYKHGRIGQFIVNDPLILGHECAGVVAKVGENVRQFKPGDRVAIEPGVPCGCCEYCKIGRYNLCPHVQFMATPPVDGAFAQYVSHPADFLYHIPDTLSYEVATLNEPFSVGVHACRRTNVQTGSTVVIMGMGPVGLMAVVAAKAFGATNIIVTDLEQNRLDEAKVLGAHHAVNINEEDPYEKIKSWTNGEGVDYAFETAGNPTALQSALSSLKAGGKLAIIGLPQQDQVELNIPFISNHEVDICGIFRYANTYSLGIELLTSESSDLSSLFTDSYCLEEAKKAMERARTNKGDSLKVMVYPNGKNE